MVERPEQPYQLIVLSSWTAEQEAVMAPYYQSQIATVSSHHCFRVQVLWKDLMYGKMEESQEQSALMEYDHADICKQGVSTCKGQ